ncbi:MAG: PQQ-dependent sugar dehydrogenase [Ferruginibacter sp.]
MYQCLFLLVLISCAQPENKKVSNITDTTRDVKETFKEKGLITPEKNDTIPFNYAVTQVKYKNVQVDLAKGISFTLNFPVGYNLSVAAEGLKRLRFLAVSPDGRLFATDMYDKSDNKKGRVLIFENWNDSNKKFTKIITYLDGLHNPNQVQFYKGHLYVAETGKLSRYAYRPGDSSPRSAPEMLATFPDFGLSYKYGGWHLTRSLAFHNDKLYVSAGSSCNACIEKETVRAVILEMNPDGSDKKIFASGLRNSVGIKWIGNQLWATGMGRDLIGPDKPEDPFQEVKKGVHYGWPFYFQYRNVIYEDVEFKDSMRTASIKKPPLAFTGFKAHSAPLGFEHFKDFDDGLLNNSVLVCLHGSTSVWRQRGNSIVKVGKGNTYTDIVWGFLTGKTEAERYGRPCDILMKDKRSFFFTDDHNGVLYYVWK